MTSAKGFAWLLLLHLDGAAADQIVKVRDSEAIGVMGDVRDEETHPSHPSANCLLAVAIYPPELAKHLSQLVDFGLGEGQPTAHLSERNGRRGVLLGS